MKDEKSKEKFRENCVLKFPCNSNGQRLLLCVLPGNINILIPDSKEPGRRYNQLGYADEILSPLSMRQETTTYWRMRPIGMQTPYKHASQRYFPRTSIN